jgi:hypothetical protein
MNDTQEVDTVTAVLDDAGARNCAGCGERAAVRTLAPTEGGLEAIVWFCFECGHEEAVTH